MILLPFLLYRQVRSRFQFKWRWIPIAVAAGLFTALDHSFWGTSIQLGRVANATLLNNVAPLWVAVFAFLVWKEHLAGRFWMGLLLTLVGAAIVFGNDWLNYPQFSLANLLGLFSSMFYAGYFLLTQHGRRHLDTLTYIWVVDLVAAVFLLVINWILNQPLSGFSSSTWLNFLTAGLVSQVIGYFSLSYALGHLSASLVAPTMIAQPVLTALIAIPLLGESLGLAQWLGGLAVLSGIYLINRNNSAIPE